MRVLTRDKIEQINGSECSECRGLLVFVLGLPPRGGFLNFYMPHRFRANWAGCI